MGLFVVIHEGDNPASGRPLLASGDPEFVAIIVQALIERLNDSSRPDMVIPMDPRRRGRDE